MNKPAETQDGR